MEAALRGPRLLTRPVIGGRWLWRYFWFVSRAVQACSRKRGIDSVLAIPFHLHGAACTHVSLVCVVFYPVFRWRTSLQIFSTTTSAPTLRTTARRRYVQRTRPDYGLSRVRQQGLISLRYVSR